MSSTVSSVSFTFVLLVFLSLATKSTSQTSNDPIKLGVLYESTTTEKVFNYAVQQLSRTNRIWRTAGQTGNSSVVQFIPRPFLASSNSFRVTDSACNLLKEKVGAIFGPRYFVPAIHIQSICQARSMPHLEMRPTYAEQASTESTNLYPYYKELGQALMDMLVLLGWTDFTVLYSTGASVLMFEQLLGKQGLSNGFKPTLRRLSLPDVTQPCNTKTYSQYRTSRNNGGSAKNPCNFKPLLKQMKSNKETSILVDSDSFSTKRFLHDALDLSMLGPQYSYVFSNLDFGLTSTIEDVREAGANITWYRLINPDHPIIKKANAEFLQKAATRKEAPRLESLENALLYDAVMVYGEALTMVAKQVNGIGDLRNPGILCDDEAVTWTPGGEQIINQLRETEMTGLSGPIQFDSVTRFRSNVTLELFYLGSTKNVLLGTWNGKRYAPNPKKPPPNIIMTGKFEINNDSDVIDLANVRITTIKEEPFVMLKQGEEADAVRTASSNQAYEGFCIDLINELAKRINFNYTIEIVKDGNYGSKVNSSNLTWNGMVGEVLRAEADIALAPLTINYDREKAIDFTKPYMYLGISILFKKPEPDKPNLFSFLQPLSIQVFSYMIDPKGALC